MQHRAVSLHRNLVKTSVFSSIVAGLVSLVMLLGISVYQTMHLQDEIMDEISDMLLISDITKSTGPEIDELSNQFDIHYRLVYEGQTLTQSEDAQNEILQDLVNQQTKPGYSIFRHQQDVWRVYVKTESDMTL